MPSQIPRREREAEADDLVVVFGCSPVASVQAFEELLGRYRPGDTIKLEVRRGDNLSTVELKLEQPKKKK